MLYRRRRTYGSSGSYRFENLRTREVMTGHGDGDFIQLKDEFGTVWNGRADVQDNETVRYCLRNERGKSLTGISDWSGIVLRDEKGNTWRGVAE